MEDNYNQFLEEDNNNIDENGTLYWAEIFNNFSDTIISDDQYNRNRVLMESISDDFYTVNTKNSKLPPEIGRKVLEIIFSNIKIYGYR